MHLQLLGKWPEGCQDIGLSHWIGSLFDIYQSRNLMKDVHYKICGEIFEVFEKKLKQVLSEDSQFHQEIEEEILHFYENLRIWGTLQCMMYTDDSFIFNQTISKAKNLLEKFSDEFTQHLVSQAKIREVEGEKPEEKESQIQQEETTQ